MLNLTKSSVSEPSFNFDDSRFKSVFPKTSRFQTDYKTSVAPDITSIEEKENLLCNFSHIVADIDQHTNETTNNKAPFECGNNQQDMGLVGGCN